LDVEHVGLSVQRVVFIKERTGNLNPILIIARVVVYVLTNVL